MCVHECALQSTRHTIWHHIVFTTIQSSFHLKTNVEILVSVPTTHRRKQKHTLYYQFCEKVGIYSVFIRSMPTRSDDFTPWPNASSFSNQSFHIVFVCVCIEWGRMFAPHFFPLTGLILYIKWRKYRSKNNTISHDDMHKHECKHTQYMTGGKN